MPKGIPKNGINKGWFKKGQKVWNAGKKNVQKSWNKGLTKETDKRVKGISDSLTGKKLSKKHIEACRKSNTGKKLSDAHKKKIGKASIKVWKNLEFRKKHKIIMNKDEIKKKCVKPHIGRIHSKEEKEKRKQSLIKYYQNYPEIKEKTKHKGKDNGMWNNGSSFEPYSTDWTEELKRKIRKRDNYTCQKCGKKWKKGMINFDVHHKDYNKKNCKENNLITLCHPCHLKTNSNRKYWIEYFNNI